MTNSSNRKRVVTDDDLQVLDAHIAYAKAQGDRAGNVVAEFDRATQEFAGVLANLEQDRIASAQALADMLTTTGIPANRIYKDTDTLPSGLPVGTDIMKYLAGGIAQRMRATASGYDEIGEPVVTVSGAPAINVSSIAALRARVASGKIRTRPVQTAGYTTPADGGGALYDPAPTDTTSVDDGGLVIVGADGLRYKMRVGSRIHVMQFGAKPDGAEDGTGTDNTLAIQRCFDAAAKFGRSISGSRRLNALTVDFGRGEYNHSSGLIASREMRLTCDTILGATLRHFGTGWQIQFGSAVLEPYTDPGRVVLNGIILENIQFEGPNGRGHLFGTIIQPHIILKNVKYNNFKGRAFDMGDANYFVWLERVHVTKTGGTRVRGNSDLFFTTQCVFGSNHGIELDVATVCFYIQNTNFENARIPAVGQNFDDAPPKVAPLTIRAKAWSGTVTSCRWGTETDGTATLYDILFTADESPDTASDVGKLVINNSVALTNNKHLSHVTTRSRTAPVAIDCGIAKLQFTGNTTSGYTSTYYAVPLDPATINSRIHGLSSVNNLCDAAGGVDPLLAGLFKLTGLINDYRINAISASSLTAGTVVYPSWSGTAATWGVPTVVTANSGATMAQAIGITSATVTAGAVKLSLYGPGTVYTSTLDTTGKAYGDPVFATNAGQLALTESTSPRVIGRVLSLGTNAKVLLTFEGRAATTTAPGAVKRAAALTAPAVPSTALTVSATPTQAEVQAIVTRLEALRVREADLEAKLVTAGITT